MMGKTRGYEIDYDYKEEYKGHVCSIDFEATVFHDRSELQNADNLDEFLKFYHDSGLIIPKSSSEDNISSKEIPAVKKLCQDCSLSSFNAPPLSERVYHLPNRTESKTCPLEKDFINGTYFEIRSAPAQVICMNPDCVRYLTPFSTTADGYSTPEFHDILYRGHPAIVKVTRAKYKCSSCNKRIPVQVIPGVEIALRYQLTSRLLKAIYDHCISSSGGISLPNEKMIAEGYGINRKKLSAYLKAERTAVIKNYFVKEAQKAEIVHKTHALYESTGLYAFSIMTFNDYSLTMFYQKAADTSHPAEIHNEDLMLKMAFDYKYIEMADAWLDGDFSYGYLSLNDEELTIFAHYYSAISHLDLAHTYFFYIVRLVLLYGQMLQKAPDLREFTLTAMLSEELSHYTFFHPECANSIVKDIYLFAQHSGQATLAEAAKTLLKYIADKSYRYQYIHDNQFFYDDRESLKFNELNNLQQVLEEDFAILPRVANQRNVDEYYQTSPALAIQRLLCFNEVAITQALGKFPSENLCDEDGVICKEIDFNGVSVKKLIELVVEKGLFSSSSQQ